MKKHEIQSFFAHVKHWQEQHGAENAFCFAKALGKNQEFHETHYPDAAGLQEDQPQLLLKKQNTKKGKEKALEMAARHTRSSAQSMSQFTSALAPDGLTPTSAPNDTALNTALKADPSMAIIDQASMMVLMSRGYPLLPPLNGPNDSDPQYAVPVATLQKSKLQLLPSRIDTQQPTDPALLSDYAAGPSRRQTRSGTMNKSAQ
jgi:hypothetical protein